MNDRIITSINEWICKLIIFLYFFYYENSKEFCQQVDNYVNFSQFVNIPYEFIVTSWQNYTLSNSK